MSMIQSTLIPLCLWNQLQGSKEYFGWGTCRDLAIKAGLGKAAIRWLKDFASPYGFYPEDEDNPGSPEPGYFTIFPRVFFDEVLRNFEGTIWANETGAIFDVAKIRKRFAQLKRRSLRENKRVLRANGYDGNVNSEVFARFNLIKKQASEIRKLAQAFSDVYGFLFPEANFYLTNTCANSGYSYHPVLDEPKNMGPGERPLPQVRLIISQPQSGSVRGKVYVTFTRGKLYTSSDTKKGKKSLNLDKPESVVDRLREFGLSVNGHDTARVLEATNTSRHKKPGRKAKKKGRNK